MSQKSGGVTFLLNFLIPGTGHLYASDGERWGYFATNVTCAVLGTMLIFPWLGNIIVWVIAMVDSGNVTAHYNGQQAGDAGAKDADWAQWRPPERATEMARQREERDEREHTASAQAQGKAVEGSRVSGRELARRLAQIHALLTAGVLDEDEARRERGQLIASSTDGWTSEDLSEFLTPFADLLQSSTVTPQDMTSVKALYQGLKKQRPDGLSGLTA